MHLYLFGKLPTSPWEALQQLQGAQASYTCRVLGAEDEQGNIELKAQWQIETKPSATLRKVSSGVHRPATPAGSQQVRAKVEDASVTPYEYLFERERQAWWPNFADQQEIRAEAKPDEPFPILDTPWHKESDQSWKLVTGLKHGEGAAVEKDSRALELARPESGSFVLVSLRRRRTKQRRRDEEQ